MRLLLLLLLLFDEEGLMISATKSNIVQELEKGKSPKELPPSCMKTGYIVDVMANVRRIKTNDLEDFGEFCDSLLNFVQHTSKGASRIDFVFDSYLETSIKDSERQKREKKLPIDLLEIERKPHFQYKWIGSGHQAETKQTWRPSFIEQSYVIHRTSE